MVPMYTQQVLMLTGTATGLILMPASIAQRLPHLCSANCWTKGRTLCRLAGHGDAGGVVGGSGCFYGLTRKYDADGDVYAVGAFRVCLCNRRNPVWNALPKTLNPHGAAILTTINPIAGAIGAAFLSVRPISARNFPAQICHNRQCWTVSIWRWVALLSALGSSCLLCV